MMNNPLLRPVQVLASASAQIRGPEKIGLWVPDHVRNAAFLCMALMCLSFSAHAQNTTEDKSLDIQNIETGSGLNAWLVEDHTVPVIAIEFAFEGAGSVNDPAEKQGLAQLASNTMDEGAGDLTSEDFQGALLNESISLSFRSGRDTFGGSLKTRTSTRDKAADLLKVALSDPRFDEDPLRRMTEANMSRIRSSLSDPEWIAARQFNDVAFEDHPYALNSGGTLSTLPKLTKEDLQNFVQSRLSKDNLEIGITGDITAEEAAAMIEEIFGGLPEDNNLSEADELILQHPGETFVYETPIPQTIIRAGIPALERDDPDYYAFQVMNQILGAGGFGSRLTKELREKRGLTYGVYSSLSNMDYTDYLNIYMSTSNENASKVMELLRAELQKMADEKVTQDELDEAVSYINGSLPLTLSSTSSIASLLLTLQIEDLPIEYLDNRAEKFDNVTRDDVQRVAQQYLKPDEMTVIMVGQPEELNKDEYTTISDLPNVK